MVNKLEPLMTRRPGSSRRRFKMYGDDPTANAEDFSQLGKLLKELT